VQGFYVTRAGAEDVDDEDTLGTRGGRRVQPPSRPASVSTRCQLGCVIPAPPRHRLGGILEEGLRGLVHLACGIYISANSLLICDFPYPVCVCAAGAPTYRGVVTLKRSHCLAYGTHPKAGHDTTIQVLRDGAHVLPRGFCYTRQLSDALIGRVWCGVREG
jgi:hypothetical protein